MSAFDRALYRMDATAPIILGSPPWPCQEPIREFRSSLENSLPHPCDISTARSMRYFSIQ